MARKPASQRLHTHPQRSNREAANLSRRWQQKRRLTSLDSPAKPRSGTITRVNSE